MMTAEMGLTTYELLIETLSCFGVFLLAVIPSLAVLVPLRLLTSVPSYVFRKLVHIAACGFCTVMILTSARWEAAVLCALATAGLIFPLLGRCERTGWYAKLFVQKSPGEVRRSMVMIFAAVALVSAIGWGAFGQRHVAAAAILMWGFGDAAAALVGIPLGRHRVKCRLTDGKKSWEGSAAMFAAAFLAGLGTLVWGQGMALRPALVTAALAALKGAATELFTPGAYDTLTIPLSIEVTLLLAAAL